MSADLDPRRVQAALVCMHLDPAYATAVRGPGKLPELTARERDLLRAVDPRALQTDRYRRARAVHVLLEEYPVTAALLGLPAVDAFFSSPDFRACVFGHGSMALSFGIYLVQRAGGCGRIEHATARARRPDPLTLPAGHLAANPRCVALLVPAGTLAFYQTLRARLGPDPVAALATARPVRERPPKGRNSEPLLVEAAPAGDVSLGTASEPLVRLLLRASAPLPRAALVKEAVELGAGDDADDLLDSLVTDGLLVAS